MPLRNLRGLDKVLGNLNQKIKEAENRTYTGLFNAASVIRKSMDQNEPMIPVDTGNLRASWTMSKLPEDFNQGPGLRIGFTASYAFWVHEAVGHNFQRPGAGAKFFAAALEREREAVLKEIREAVNFDSSFEK